MNLVGSLKFQKPITKFFFQHAIFQKFGTKGFFYYENFQKLESKGALNLS
jgi:hypothetical protein